MGGAGRGVCGGASGEAEVKIEGGLRSTKDGGVPALPPPPPPQQPATIRPFVQSSGI